MVKNIFLLLAGGALGTLARYGLNGWLSGLSWRHTVWFATFPLGTLLVNISGCFAIGLIAALTGPALGRAWIRPDWRDFLMIGFCGGYTTYSSFALETLNLARDGEWAWVAVNVAGTNILCLAAVYIGWILGRLVQT